MGLAVYGLEHEPVVVPSSFATTLTASNTFDQLTQIMKAINNAQKTYYISRKLSLFLEGKEEGNGHNI